MHIFNDLSEVSYDKNSIITLGTFDGIHLGHKEIIDGAAAARFLRWVCEVLEEPFNVLLEG